MSTFSYEAFDSVGKLHVGVIEASSTEELVERLVKSGLTPYVTRTAADAGSWWNKDISFRRDFSARELLSFTREFATLQLAQLPLDDCLRILKEESRAPRVGKLVSRLLGDLLDGKALSAALAEHPTHFSGEYLDIVRAGEASGSLGSAFGELSALLERRQELRAKLVSALIYPTLLITLSIASIAILCAFLAPNIAPIFIENGKQPPTLVSFAVTLDEHGTLIGMSAIILGAASFALFTISQRSTQLRNAIGSAALKLPAFREFVTARDTARMTRTLGSLLKAGVPLAPAMNASSSVMLNQQLKSRVLAALEDVKHGEALAKSLKNNSALPQLALRMIMVGEETGKLDQLLVKTANIFEQQYLRWVERCTTLLTPMLTVAISLVVGTLIMTVMSAILSINDLASQ